MQKRSVTLSGHATSVSLEPEFWEALDAIAQGQGKPVSRLIGEIDRARLAHGSDTLTNSGLSSALRVYILKAYRDGWDDER